MKMKILCHVGTWCASQFKAIAWGMRRCIQCELMNMGMAKRQNFSNQFKGAVALEGLHAEKEPLQKITAKW